MARIELHPNFKEFLKLLAAHEVDYLIVGGYAVGYHGYPRATGDMDIWIAANANNAERVARALRDFGIPNRKFTKDLFTEKDQIIRVGVPPVRIELVTTATGVDFYRRHSRREIVDLDGTPASFISLDDLKANQKACGRYKDLEDLEHLP